MTNQNNPVKNITYIYTQEQIDEIQAQLPQNLDTCKKRISEIQEQLGQYDELIKQLESKIQKADQLIADKADRNEPQGESANVLQVNCQTVTGRRSGNEDEEVATIVKIEQKPRFQFLGVFDGHGGVDTASYCKKSLLNNLMATKFIQQNQLSIALQEAIILTDQQYCEVDNQKGQVGTTAACVLIDLKRKVVAMANTGDARVLIQLKNDTFHCTNDHKPSSDSEKKRLKDNFNTEVYDFGGIMRVNGQLAVSRAIGDIDFKIYGVLALPQIYDEISLNDINFIIVACDGLWDVLQNEQVVQIVSACLGKPEKVTEENKLMADAAVHYIDGKQEEGDQLLLNRYNCEAIEGNQLDINREDIQGKIAQALVRIAYIMGSQDNITCIVALNQ